jgi:hypothetical protein
MEDRSMTPTSIRARNLAAAISIAFATAGLHAATIIVDSSDDDPGSLACNLRSALKAVNDGSTLAVANCSAAVSGDPFGISDTIVLAGLSPITLTQGALTVAASSVTIDGSGTIPPPLLGDPYPGAIAGVCRPTAANVSAKADQDSRQTRR